MTCFRSRFGSNFRISRPLRLCLPAALVVALSSAAIARGDLPFWQQTVVSASAVEAALFSPMQLPGAEVSYPRPPRTAEGAVSKLIAAAPAQAELYALRAQTEEGALDFDAAARDWIAFAAQAPDKAAGNRQLADFYGRRLDGPHEIGALEASATAPQSIADAVLPADQQAAWRDFGRALDVAQRQALGEDAQLAIYAAWIARYPTQPAARANEIAAMLRLKRLRAASDAIAAYRQAFPQDRSFVIKASAAAAAESGGPDAGSRALAIYDAAYQPLWSADLSQSYFTLLEATHTEHAMLAKARAALEKNPDDLAAVTRIFQYFQHGGRNAAAANAFAQYRASKEARRAAWSADELYAFATLLAQAGFAEEAARYDFALAGVAGPLHLSPEPAEQLALANTIDLLLNSSEKPIALGAGNLSVYRDLATVDTGPGYWNGILSLWLNSTSPATELAAEDGKATPYFHRGKAAELLSVLDTRFPAAPERDHLHAALLRAYLSYGEDDALITGGTQFIAEFPHANDRLEVALAVADAYARQGKSQAETALYDSLLTSLAGSLGGMPLTAANPSGEPSTVQSASAADPSREGDSAITEDAQHFPQLAATTPKPPAAELLLRSLQASVQRPATSAPAAAYGQVLERYLSRLTATDQLPAALAVLRRELDRNPNDPLLYDRLAAFLAQNDLSAQEEGVYQAAIQRFNSPGFYNKLARFYIRQKRREDFAALTRKVTDIFSGTELEGYFADVNRSWPQVYLQLNLYAHARFPHDLRFTRNLLTAYRAKGTADAGAREKLLRQHWWEAPDLQAEFFEYLSRTHTLSAELAQLQQLAPANDSTNPSTAPSTRDDLAAIRELAEIHLWQSHFEQGAPSLRILAQAYPADPVVGEDAESVFRSLAYEHPEGIEEAVSIERNLAAAQPANLDRLATIGDIYANSTSPELNLPGTAQLAQADPYWTRISAVQRGVPDGYLQSATVFWDYFQFDKALAQIAAARRQFGEPTLYGFEAGALDEDMGKPALAIDEYARTAAAEEAIVAGNNANSPSPDDTEAPGNSANETAKGRLLILARRSSTAATVDSATAKLLTETRSVGALQLRVDVLRVQHRQAEIAAAVQSAITAAATPDELTQLAAFSQRERLPHAYVQALTREVSLAADPVERIDLEYQLVHAYEDQGDDTSAGRIVEAVYRDQPKILGVVRTTVDFYWKGKQPQRAVATLEGAASAANPTLAHDFMLEAIAKSNASGEYAGARGLLKPLLAADPFNAQYIALKADSYALAHDNTGLRDFYAGTITAIQASSLSGSEKRADIALARQGIIPALTDLKDYSGATDQFIALLRAAPEDADLVQRAALYARRYSRQPQLVAFLNKAVADSPRDSRFAIDLGRADELFEDYDGALAAYSKAIAIRGDRTDLYIARADLEEHRQDFEAACSDYARLFTLSYDDPQWMEKAALARVREGKPDLATQALEAAWITNRPVSAANFFHVAAQLEQWNLLPEARLYAERGTAMAGDDLLADAQYADGVKTYAKILARQGNASEALAKLLAWSGSASVSSSSPAIVVEQVRQEGIGAVTDAQWRELRAKRRNQQAKETLTGALTALGQAVAALYTPEEKLAYAKLLDTHRANASTAEVAGLWIPAAHEAGLLDREAAWRRDLLLTAGDPARNQLQPYIELEQRRLDFSTLASTLDTYAAQGKRERQPALLNTAVTSWRSAGDTAHELHDLRLLVVTFAQTQWQDRLFGLLLQSDPAALLALVSANAPYSDTAANYALANGSRDLAYRAIAARDGSLPPVWRTANSALAGLYFREVSARTDADFRSALHDVTLGAQLAGKPDPNRVLTGALWFSFGTRYGAYRTLSPAPAADPEDYLPAVLEGAPDAPVAYTQLGGTYLDAGEREAAIAEFRHAIQLAPADPAPSIAIAEQLWAKGQQAEAVAEWEHALAQLHGLINERSVPETFWTSFTAVASDIREYNLNEQLDSGLGDVLRTYIRKNDRFRSSELLQAAYVSQKKRGPAAAAASVLGFVADAQSQRALLSDLIDSTWFPDAQRGAVYRRELELAQAEQAAASPSSIDTGSGAVDAYLPRYLGWLLKHRQAAQARQLLDSLPPAKQANAEFAPYAIELAAQQSRIPELIAVWNSDPDQAPDLRAVGNAAEQLRHEKDLTGSRALLEYLFNRKLAENGLEEADYLALAEARLATGDTPGALDLLRRYTLETADFYDGLDAAAQLLVRTGHNADAIPFLRKLANGTPWKAIYLQRLGMAQLAAGNAPNAADALGEVASSANAPYAVRADAATALRNLPGTHHFASAELTMIASAAASSPQTADQPYFTYARLAAAAPAAPVTGAHLLQAAIAIAPEAFRSRLQLALFYAAFKAGYDEQASAAIQPLLAHYPELTVNAAVLSNAYQFPEAACDSACDTPSLTVPPELQDAADRRRLLLALTSLHEHLHEQPQALQLLQAAQNLGSKQEQAAVEARIAQLTYGLALKRENDARRPILQATLADSSRVRPRLLPGSPIPSSSGRVSQP